MADRSSYFYRTCVLLLSAVLALLAIPAMKSFAESEGLIDNLDNFNYVGQRSSNIVTDSSNPGNIGNDSTRITRNSTSSGYFVYKTGYDIQSFTVPAYFWMGTPVVDVKFFVSQNGTDFVPVTPRVYQSGPMVSDWQLFVYEAFNLPLGSRYLKIQLEGDVKFWTPQISKVILNLKTASVEASIPSGTVVDGKQIVSLSSLTPGAEIYYKKDTDTAYTLYSEPIAITTRTTIEAYAQKSGLENSYLKTFQYISKDDWQIDRFGQVIRTSFPDKVTDDAQLREDATKDEEYYSGLSVPSNRDAYGGLAGSKEQYGLDATGFFNIQNAGDRKVLVTPSGNAFFSMGVNVISVNETYTKVAGREKIFEWIPPFNGSEFTTAFRGNKDEISYYLANRIRKTGKPYADEQFYTEAFDRIQKWGFNTAGAWSGNCSRKYNHPHVKMLPIGGMTWAQVDGMHYFDIFVDGAEQKIDQVFASALSPDKDDPSLIGYFMDNEIHFHKIPTEIPKAKASKVASKRKLVDLLKEKYAGDIAAFNTAWNTQFADFGDLYEAEMTVATQKAKDDLYDFIKVYADALYGTFAKVFRKHDPNHLLLGDRWLTYPIRDERMKNILAEAVGNYFDVISFNYYSTTLNTDLLKDIHVRSGGKPILITEFNYGTAEQGLNNGVIPVPSQNDRQLKYRNYVELAASLGFIVGTHWFNYVDQPATGRWWEGYNGEHYNTGLINVADRPYKSFLQEIKKTNDDIYSVLFGQREPFLGRGNSKVLEIPYAYTPVQIDGLPDLQYGSANQNVLASVDRVIGIGGEGMKGEFPFAWDDDHLYLYAQIKDPTPMLNHYQSSSVWKGDAVELFVGSEDQNNRNGLMATDRQLIMSAGVLNNQNYWQWFNTSVQSPIRMIVVKNAANDGYAVEAAVPWSALNVTPQMGRELLFDFGFVDSEDGINRSRQWIWNGLDGNSSYRGYWGRAVLAEGADSVKPVISVTGVSEGQSYTDQVIPVVSVSDQESGLKENSIRIDGVDWTDGTAVVSKGRHTLVVSAVDNAGNTATETVQFTVYQSTILEAYPAAGVYSDAVQLQAVLKDKNGQPVVGENVAFLVNDMIVGSALTDLNGKAALEYNVKNGADTDTDSRAYRMKAAYLRNDTTFYDGSEAAATLTVNKEEASVAFTGSRSIPVNGEVTLAAIVTQDQDGSFGSLEGLPVQFNLSEVHPDGTIRPLSSTVTGSVYSTVTRSVYHTDASGAVSVRMNLPAGYYEVKTVLLDNAYYKANETVSRIGVYDPAAGGFRLDGYIDLTDGQTFMGDRAKKVHFNAKWSYDGQSSGGKQLRIHAEPQGKELTFNAVDWMVVAGNNIYLEGTAKSGVETYSIMLMFGTGALDQTNPIASIRIWKRNDISATPVFQIYGASLSGSISVR